MKRIFSLHQFLALVVMLLALPGLVRAQFQKPDVSMPSPNAASLGLYGEVPISLYTGTPNIDIPLYTLEEGKIKVPISLSYHASGVRVNQHPGWVGLNWNLNAGGAITRVVKDLPDEFDVIYQNQRFQLGYYFQNNRQMLNVSNWNNKNYFKDLNIIDTDPDEFNFNFLGFSGTFFLDATGKWGVRSDQNISVIMDSDFIELPSDLVAKTVDRGYSIKNLNGQEKNINRPMFKNIKGFTLIANDGTKYYFGGDDNTIEYSVPFFNQPNSCWIANTWYLKKITTTQGYSVNFTYKVWSWQQGKFTASFSPSIYAVTRSNTSGAQTGFVQNFLKALVFNADLRTACSSYSSILPASSEFIGLNTGSLTRTVYLDKISSDRAEVTFQSDTTSELKYNYSMFIPLLNRYFISGKDNTENVFPYLKLNREERLSSGDRTEYAQQTINKLIFRKLKSITVKAAATISTQQINLNYNDDKGYVAERLMLKGLAFVDKNLSTCLNKYSFSYYTNSSTALPGYCEDTDKTDHWGFANGRSFNLMSISNSTVANFEQNKQAAAVGNDNYRVEGSLKSISYPTGGETIFTYEAHKAYGYQDFSSNGLFVQTANVPLVGGIRIKQIENKTADNSKIIQYEYKFGNDNKSSGILAGKPRYYWPDYKAVTIEGLTVSRSIFSYQNLLPGSTNASGSHIGYRQVKEIHVGNGYKIYNFTNFESLDGSHFDELVSDSSRLQITQAEYDPRIDKSFERGKLIFEAHLAANGDSLFLQRTFYKAQSNDFVRAATPEYFQACNGAADNAYTGIAYRKYYYRYLPSFVQTRQFEQGNISKSTYDITENVFNFVGLPSQVKTTRNGKSITTKSSYVADFGSLSSNAEPLKAMYNQGMVGMPVEQQIWSNESGTNGIIGGFYNTYKNFGSAGYQVDSTKQFTTTQPQTSNTALAQVASGVFQKSGVNYNKAVVTFASYTDRGEPTKFTDGAGIVTNLSWYTGTKAGLLQSKTIGGLTTQYDYLPLVGLEKETDPNGRTITYSYDGFNRLSTIRDHEGNLLKSFAYNYQNSTGCPNYSVVKVEKDEPIPNPFESTSTCPAPVITASQTNLTASGSVTLTVTNYQPGSLVTWKTAAGTVVGTPTASATTTVNVTATTTYTATYTLNGCQSVASNAVTITLPAPTGCVVNKVRIQFRSDCCLERLQGATIQASNDNQNWTTLHTISVNGTGNWQEFSFNNTQSYAYIRFVAGPNGFGELKELEFYNGSQKLSGTAFGSSNVYGGCNTCSYTNVFDGNLTEIWHGASPGSSNFAGLQLTGCTTPAPAGCVVNRVRFNFPANDWLPRLIGATIQASNDNQNWTTLHTFTSQAVPGWQEVTLSNTQSYAYIRFVAGSNGFGELVELEFYNGSQKLSGTAFGSSSVYGGCNTCSYTNVFDGQLTEVWHGASPGSSNFAGLQLTGCTTTAPVNNACYALRSPINNKVMQAMANGYIQKADANTSIAAQAYQFELNNGYYKITAFNGKVLGIENGGSSNGNKITQQDYTGADHQLWQRVEVSGGKVGFARKGTGNAWDFEGSGNGDYLQVWGNAGDIPNIAPNQWFLEERSCPAPTGCVVNRVRFNFPANDWLPRLIGATIQASNDNQNWTTLHTFTSQAVPGWQEVTLSNTQAYAYIRFVAGSNGFGELVELEFYNGSQKLSGTAFGSSSVYGGCNTCSYTNVFDGNLTEVWHGASPGSSNFAGLQLTGCTTTGKLQVSLDNISGQPSIKKRITIANPNAGTRTYTWYIYQGDSFVGIGPNVVSANGSFDVDLSSFNLIAGTSYRLWVGDAGESTNARHNYAPFTHAAPTYLRALVLGNSITKITWDPIQNGNGWGMAASTRDKDFAHVLEGYLKTKASTARVVPTYIAKFEYRSGWNANLTVNLAGEPAPQLAFSYDTLQTLVQQNFSGATPDLVILRVVENVDDGRVLINNFKDGYLKLINKVRQVAPGATILLTTSFWEKNLTADARIRELAFEQNLPLVDLSDMRFYPQFKAGHDVATQAAFPTTSYDFNEHPGDVGMKEIADRIWAKLQGTAYTVAAVKPTPGPAWAKVKSPLTNARVKGNYSNGLLTMDLEFEVKVPATSHVGRVEVMASLADATNSFTSVKGVAMADPSNPTIYRLSKTVGTAAGQWSGGALDPNAYKFWVRILGLNESSNRFYFNSDTVTVDLSAQTETCSSRGATINSASTVAGTRVSTSQEDTYTIPFALLVCMPQETKGAVELWASLPDGSYASKIAEAKSRNGSTSTYDVLNSYGSDAGQWLRQGLYAGSYRFWIVVKNASGNATLLETTPVTITIQGDGPVAPTCATAVVQMVSPTNNSNQPGTQQTRSDGSKGFTMPLSMQVCLPSGQGVSKVEFYASLTNGSFESKIGTGLRSTSDLKVYTLSSTMGTAAGQWSGIALDPNTYKFYAKVTKTDQSVVVTPAFTIDLSGVATSGCSTVSAAITSDASIAGTLVSGSTDVYTIPLSLTACLPGETKGNVEVWVSLTDGGYARRVGTAASVNYSTVNFAIANALNYDGVGAWDGNAGGLYAGSYLFWVKVFKSDGTLAIESPKKTITITGSSVTTCSTPTATLTSPSSGNYQTGLIDNRSDGTKGVTIPVSVNVCLPSGQSVASVEIWASMTDDSWARKVGTATLSSGNTYTMQASLGSNAGQWLSSGGSLDPNTYKFWAVVNRAGNLSAVSSSKNTINIAGVSSTTCTQTSLTWDGPGNNTSRTGTLVSGSTNTYTIPFQVTACYPGQSIGSIEIWASTMDGGWPRRVGNAIPSNGSSSVYRIETGTNAAGSGKWRADPGGLYAGSYKFWAIVKKVDGSEVINTQSSAATITITAPSNGGRAKAEE